jgi:two-component system sensor histidine kinase KdpD
VNRERIDDDRPTAEQMLERVRREGSEGMRGRHRIYLGMAPGVGKTHDALVELNRLKATGVDAVIGFVETYNRPKTIEAIQDLEVIPRKQVEYKGVTLEEMDTEAVVRRRPAVVLIDELAHTNAPGSKHEKRWQDAEEVLDHGISVVSTVNVQHLESLADIVENITGVKVRERLPDRIIEEADEIELVDIPPIALRERIEQGHVYSRDRAERALQQFFREGNLNALRELALRTVANAVEQDLEDYMRQHDIDAAWSASERVMVCVDAQPQAQVLLRRGWRMADRRQTDLLAVFVETPQWARASAEERRVLEENLRYAEDLGAEVVRVRAGDVAEGLLQVARDKNVGSIVIGHSRQGRFRELLRRSVVSRVLRLARDVDVHVVADREERA